jgi:hypothetical protein
MNNDPRNIMPGDKVLVFDSSIYINDIVTPLSVTLRPATVVCRYGEKTISHMNCVHYWDSPICEPDTWLYPDIVDVVFDHRPERVSHGHFTDSVEVI